VSVADISIEARFYAELGRKLEQKRKQRRLSREDLARESGIHRNTILRWESGDSAVPIWNLLRVCDILSCQHLLLLPAREYTWGADYDPMQKERDRAMLKAIKSERDPILTRIEMALAERRRA
jgi:transcriptional regulator with XRE-family HTH domain